MPRDITIFSATMWWRRVTKRHNPIPIKLASFPSSRAKSQMTFPSIEVNNPYAKLVSNQHIVEVPEYTLESGDVIRKVPVAYKTWGHLNEKGDNVMVICHALTGSADVADWWGPLLGEGLSFDPTRFFIVCLNALGSPYGSASPLTVNPDTGRPYGPEFPLCTVRDDAGIHKMVLDSIGVKSIAVAIGGSMGGTLVLEWAASYPDYVRNFVALATSARHSAWCISWSEAQRQSIYSDPKYHDGYYGNDPPNTGLAAARMSALLTYRSRNSFESRFGRQSNNGQTTPRRCSSNLEENFLVHNDGHKARQHSVASNSSSSSRGSLDRSDSVDSVSSTATSTTSVAESKKKPQTNFSAQSYLRYQGDKFVSRFDANCYIAISRKLDAHDIARDRGEMEDILAGMKQPSLIIGIKSDGLFTYSEQEYLASHLANSRLEEIDYPEGHDAFLLEFSYINNLIMQFLNKNLPEIMSLPGIPWNEPHQIVTNSVFGEAEDVTNW